MIPDPVARLVGNLAALWVVSELFDNITYGDDFWILLLAAGVLTLANAFVKPIVAILAIPVIVLTLGIAYFFVNVLMLAVTDWIVSDFEVEGFWTYVGATIVIWALNLLIGALIKDFRVDK